MNTAAGIPSTGGRRPRVLVVYHFFAHYRGGAIAELCRSRLFEYVFCGDTKDPACSGIRPYAWLGDENRIVVGSRYVVLGLLLQWRVVRLALTGDFAGYIFLGDPHFITTWIGAAIARLRRRRVLFWTQGWKRSDDRSLKAQLRDAFFRLAHGLLLYGDRAKVIGVRRGFRPEALYVIYNSLPRRVDTRDEETLRERVRVTREELSWIPGETVIVCPGRLIETRGLHLLIEAVALLRIQGFSARMVLIGAGPARLSLEQLARAREVPVVFVGECYDDLRLAEWFGVADLTVIPHRSGLSVVQSLAFGTPVLTGDDPESEMPEWEAIEPGVTGAFYRDGDIGDLARAIERWVARPRDRQRIRQLCMKAIEDHFNPTFQMKVIEEALTGDAATDPRWLEGRWDAKDQMIRPPSLECALRV